MREITFQAASGQTVRLHLCPPRRSPAGPVPTAVFFHGGGWVKGDWTQFRPQAERLAELGMPAVLVQYRLQGPVPATEDAIDAMAAVAEHADELGADPARLLVVGGSAGGHLALATALLELPNRVSVRPAALALLNPVTDTTGDFPSGFGRRSFDNDAQARRYSPLHRVDRAGVRAGLPPMVIMHGTADAAVHHQNSVDFAAAVQRQGGRCELVLYPDQQHGFFNPRTGGTAWDDADHERHFELTTAEIVRFARAMFGTPHH